MKFLWSFLFANFIFIFPFNVFTSSDLPEAIETIDLYKKFGLGIGLLPEDRQDLSYIHEEAVNGNSVEQYRMAEMLMHQAEILDSNEAYKQVENVDPRLASLLKTAYHVEAFEWYRISAKTFLKAQYKLAQMYAIGLGTQIDLDRAVYWYSIAAQNSHKEAKEILESADDTVKKFLSDRSCRDSF